MMLIIVFGGLIVFMRGCCMKETSEYRNDSESSANRLRPVNHCRGDWVC